MRSAAFSQLTGSLVEEEQSIKVADFLRSAAFSQLTGRRAQCSYLDASNIYRLILSCIIIAKVQVFSDDDIKIKFTLRKTLKQSANVLEEYKWRFRSISTKRIIGNSISML